MKLNLTDKLDALRAHLRLVIADAETEGQRAIAMRLTGVQDAVSEIWREARRA